MPDARCTEGLNDPEQALRAVDAYDQIWHVGPILFGVHLLLLGVLAYRSDFMPNIFGILLMVAGLGYLADGFGAVLIQDYSMNIAQFTFVGEAALMFWLLIKGRRKDFSHGPAGQVSIWTPTLGRHQVR